MDLGTALVILGGISGFELLKEVVKGAANEIGQQVKGAANEVGHQVAKQLAAQVRQAIDRLCKRRRVSAEVTVPSGRIIAFGAEHAGQTLKSASAAMPANIGTLGLVILGASRFPYLEGLDNPAFARSAATAKALFGRETTVFKRTAVLDLFDEPKGPADIIDAIDLHMNAYPDMRDLLIYYCGHCGFMRNRNYFLTLTGTRKDREASTGLKLRELRHDLENKLINRRLYMILDCCYAGEAVKEFMFNNVDKAIEDEVMQALPSHGWTMLVAASPDGVAMAPTGRELTMFTEALTHVLTSHEIGAGRALSLAEITYKSDLYIRRTHGLKAVRPQCHSPRQDAGDLAHSALFVNVANPHGTTRTNTDRTDAERHDRAAKPSGASTCG